MIISQFEVKLYKNLETFFSKEDFELLIDKKQFRKTTQNGFQNIIFSVSEAKKEILVEVNFGLRHEQTEYIAQQFLNNAIDFRADANTLVISIGKFNDLKYFRFKIDNEDDLGEISEQIIYFFEQRGIKFLDNSSKLINLEKILNQEANKPCKFVYNQVHRAFKGIIAAKLANRPHLSELIDNYRNFLFKTASDEELLNFERLVSFLLHYSPN